MLYQQDEIITGGEDNFIIIWKDSKQLKKIPLENNQIIYSIKLSIN